MTSWLLGKTINANSAGGGSGSWPCTQCCSALTSLEFDQIVCFWRSDREFLNSMIVYTDTLYSKRQRHLKEGCCVGLLAERERESCWIAERSTAKKHHRKQLRDRLWKADESCCKRNDVSTICLTNKFAKPWKSLAQGTTGTDAANFLRHHFFCSLNMDHNGETGRLSGNGWKDDFCRIILQLNFCGIFAYSFKGKFYGRSPAYL